MEFFRKYFWLILVLYYVMSFFVFIGGFYITDYINFTEGHFDDTESIKRVIIGSLICSLGLLVLPLVMYFYPEKLR